MCRGWGGGKSIYGMRGEMDVKDCEGVRYKRKRRGVCVKWKRESGIVLKDKEEGLDKEVCFVRLSS